MEGGREIEGGKGEGGREEERWREGRERDLGGRLEMLSVFDMCPFQFGAHHLLP